MLTSTGATAEPGIVPLMDVGVAGPPLSKPCRPFVMQRGLWGVAQRPKRRRIGSAARGKSPDVHTHRRLCSESISNATAGGISCSTSVTTHNYIQVRGCDLSVLESAQNMFCSYGWPLPEDDATRTYITEILGLKRVGRNRTSPSKTSTYFGWAASGDESGGTLVAASILSVYRYHDRRRRCAVLEFIVSDARGAGWALVRLAGRFLLDQGISQLFSAADLSRPIALGSHLRWGFSAVTLEVWTTAGLAFYERGDVQYMKLDLSDDGCEVGQAET